MPQRSVSGYGERMARIETTLEFVKDEASETKQDVKDLKETLNRFIAAAEKREAHLLETCDSRYAKKEVEDFINLFRSKIVWWVLGITAASLLVLILTHKDAVEAILKGVFA